MNVQLQPVDCDAIALPLEKEELLRHKHNPRSRDKLELLFDIGVCKSKVRGNILGCNEIARRKS